MEKSFFFNSKDGNRIYNADSFAEAYKPLFTNGVFNGELQVLADSGMSVKVMPGYAWINGRTYWNTDEKVLSLKAAIEQEKRIDSIVVRLDEIEGEIVTIALKGEEGLEPEPPVLQREAGYYDLRIAEILVRPGVLEIGQADITDTRMDTEKCGWVAGAVKQISFEQVTAQFDSFLELYKEAKEEEFLDWFEHTGAARIAAKEAESWAHGGTETREGEEEDNSKYFYQLVKGIYENIKNSGNIAERVIGTYVKLLSGNEGGNLRLTAMDGTEWEVNVQDGNLRIFPSANGASSASLFGVGLSPSTEKTYDVLMPDTLFSKYSSYAEGTDYVVQYEAVSPSTAAGNFLYPYMGAELDMIRPYLPSGFVLYVGDEFYGCDRVVVDGSTSLLAYYDSEQMADNVAPSSFHVSCKKYAGTKTPYQTIFGSYNKNKVHEPGCTPIFTVGNGTPDSSSTALSLDRKCQMYLGTGGAYHTSGADCAYRYEYLDGNPNGEDRIGLFVTLVGDKVRIAEEGDYIFGVVSGIAGLIGNSDEEWMGRYMRDAFGRILYENVQLESREVVVRPVQNPEYDPEQTYVPREERKEWDKIGIWGVLPVRDDGTCVPGRFCKCGSGGIATLAEKRGYDTFYVEKRATNNIVWIVLKGS